MPGKTQIFGDQIVNGSITNDQISATATIDASKITPPGSTLQLIYNNAGAFAAAPGITTNGAGTTLAIAAFTVDRVLISDASKNIISSSVTTTTLNFLDATSSIQTQLNNKQATGNYITALTGDVTATGPGSVPATLATVNGNVGAFTNANITVNAKGLITAASNGSPGGVTSITGTADQVLANATSGSPQTGAVTLTLPQSIATTSSPAFQNLTLGSTTLGGLLLNDTTGTPRTITWSAPTTVSASYVVRLPPAQGAVSTALVNDGAGNLSWGSAGAGTITQNTYTVGTASGTYTGSTTLFNLPFTYVQDGKSLQVMYNGQILVSGVDYNETSNTSVTFLTARTAGFTVVFRYITPSTPSNTSVAQYANFVVGTPSGTYTGSTTVYNLPFAYTQDAKSLQFFYDGVQLVPGDDYTETSSTSVTTTQALVLSQKVAFRTVSTLGNAAAVTALRENYVVGTASGNYTGSLSVFNLINSYTPGGINLQVFLDGDLQTVGAGNDYVETNGTTVTFNFNLVATQKVTFLFSQTVAATGTVTSATSGQLAYYSATGSTVAGTSGPIRLDNGTAAAPTYSFGTEVNTGMFLNGATTLGMSVSGVTQVNVTPTTIQLLTPFVDLRKDTASVLTSMRILNNDATSLTSNAALTLATNNGGGDPYLNWTCQNTAMYGMGQDNSDGTRLKLYANTASPTNGHNPSDGTNINLMIFNTSGTTGQVMFPNNAVGTPSIAWITDPDTGFYNAGTADTIRIAAGGVQRVRIDNTGSAFFTPVLLSDGSATNPGLAFDLDTNSGIYRGGADNWFFAAGGNGVLQILDSAIVPQRNTYPGLDNTYSCGLVANRWTAVFAVNGTIQTSHSSTKTDIIEMDPLTLETPRGIFFKRPGDEKVHVGFEADNLPKQAFYEDGVSVETSSVIGVLCAKVRYLENELKKLKGE